MHVERCSFAVQYKAKRATLRLCARVAIRIILGIILHCIIIGIIARNGIGNETINTPRVLCGVPKVEVQKDHERAFLGPHCRCFVRGSRGTVGMD